MPDDRMLTLVITSEIIATDAMGNTESLTKTTETRALTRGAPVRINARVDVSDPSPDRAVSIGLTDG